MTDVTRGSFHVPEIPPGMTVVGCVRPGHLEDYSAGSVEWPRPSHRVICFQGHPAGPMTKDWERLLMIEENICADGDWQAGHTIFCLHRDTEEYPGKSELRFQICKVEKAGRKWLTTDRGRFERDTLLADGQGYSSDWQGYPSRADAIEAHLARRWLHAIRQGLMSRARDHEFTTDVLAEVARLLDIPLDEDCNL